MLDKGDYNIHHYLDSYKRYSLENGEKDKIIEQIQKELYRVEGIRFSFLHGSFFEGNEFRDIDVAVFFEDNMISTNNLEFCEELSVTLTHEIKIPVDVTSLNQAPLSYCYHASKGDVLTYKSMEEVFQYKEDIWIEYIDFRPYIEENLLDLLG